MPGCLEECADCNYDATEPQITLHSYHCKTCDAETMKTTTNTCDGKVTRKTFACILIISHSASQLRRFNSWRQFIVHGIPEMSTRQEPELVRVKRGL